MHRATIILMLCFALPLIGACGDEIGDSCSASSDCAQDGTRICDNTQPEGYCTIQGCDFGSCPDEAICVRFYSVGNTGKACVPETEDISTDDCAPDERCNLNSNCVPRAAEVRYCMRQCDDDTGCREKYECRTKELMLIHGGEPVARPGEAVPLDPQPFCAPAPVTTN